MTDNLNKYGYPIRLKLNDHERKAVRHAAAEAGVGQSEVLHRAVCDWLKRNGWLKANETSETR